MSLRKSLSETSSPSPALKSQTLFAHFSNSVSWVTPRSSVIASYSVRPGDFRLLLGSPPSRCLATSVVRFSMLTLLTPATYLPSHLTRNLKFLYGSNRCALMVNSAIMCAPFYQIDKSAPNTTVRYHRLLDSDLAGHLLKLNNHKLSRLERCKANHDIDNTQIDIVLDGGFFIALDK